jgi:succinate dehydrogenase / fumarate reductase, cytochrome b subunit
MDVARGPTFDRSMRSLVDNVGQPSFFQRHEFLLRRLHSLAGLVPVGAYMVVHLLTNASVWNGAGTFQAAVYQIHSLGAVLPIVEWTFIFLPILFHGIYGLVIMRESQPNNGSYPLSGNLRYTLQRATGLIAFLFIGWHVFHMHGWIHADAWEEFVAPFGANFKAYNATSTAAVAIQQSSLVMAGYAIGVLACVFHFANGVWTFGITWGLWTTPAAQQRANYIAAGVGLVLLVIGTAAWSGFAVKLDTSDPEVMSELRALEERMLQHRIDAGLLDEKQAEKKRSHAPATDETAQGDESEGTAPLNRDDSEPSEQSL